MTALDQAIIKAYLRQGGLPTAEETESAEPVCVDVVPQETAQASSLPELERSRDCHTARSVSVPLSALDLSVLGPPGEFAKVIERPDKGVAAAAGRPTESQSTRAEPETPSIGVIADRVFEPMLRVDAISWPRPSRRLRHVASEQIERLADAIQKKSASGAKVLGVAGFSHGEGCTTVLLAVALRLVELGQKTLLLDGDVVKPRLPEQLALENDLGWRDVAVGSLRLEDAVTQSDSECLALLPYSGQETPTDGPEPSRQAIATLLDQIRTHYDMVLVDLGGAVTSGGSLAEKLVEQLDSVLAVQNVQVTSPSHLAMLRKHFRRLGVEQIGVIENFVEDGTASTVR